MSSEPEESTDHPNEATVGSIASEEPISAVKKENGVNEHAKPKRRRRGKKHKQRKESAATCEREIHEECNGELAGEHEIHFSPTWDSNEDLSCDVSAFTDVIIRPINVPKAPENSTQFIMDDHNECRLYMSFETPNPYLADPPQHGKNDGDIVEPVGEDAAYRDIDYEYESPQDFDNSAYYDKEFEQSYKNNRFDELMTLPRGELVEMLQSLESRTKELNDELVKENPSPMLEKLQHKLLELQEKHNYLQECNLKLTSLVHNEADCSGDELAFESPDESHSYLNIDSASFESVEDSHEGHALGSAEDYQSELMLQDGLTLESPESPEEWQQELLSRSSGVCREYHDLCREGDESSDGTLVPSCVDSEDQDRNHAHGDSVTALLDPRLKLRLDPESETSEGDARPMEQIPILPVAFSSPEDSVEADNFLPHVCDSSRDSNNIDSEMLSVTIQEKCSSEVLRDEELPAAEASVI